MIFALNDAPHRRREGVLFGTTEKTPCTCFEAPGGFIGVSVIDVDPGPNNHEGHHAETDGQPPTFVRHSAVEAAFAAGIPYRMTLNGRTTAFEVAESIINHPRVRVTSYLARDPTAPPQGPSRGTCWLFTTEFHRQATIRFELLYFYENLAETKGPVPTLSFSLAGVTNLRQLKVYYAQTTANLFQGYVGIPDAGNIPDAAGGYWEGCLPFETAEMAANRTTHPEAITQSAQLVHPLYSAVTHATWGLWRQPPLTTPEVTKANRDADNATALAAVNSQAHNPFAHLGYIMNRRPADTGGQAELGNWWHTMNALGGDPADGVDSRSIWLLHLAAMRSANRPIWYTEADGRMLSPTTNQWPTARVFWESIHWEQPGTNRFRRTRSSNTPDGSFWHGHRREHFGWMHVASDFLLTGSMAARHMLIHMQTLMACTEPTTEIRSGSGGTAGRSVGRALLGAAMAYLATGVDRGLRSFVGAAWDLVYSIWTNELCLSTDTFRPFSFERGPTFQYPTGLWVWVGWQDSIMATGIDAALIADDLSERTIFPAPMRTQMEEVRLALARAIVNLSFAPAHTCGTSFFPDGSVTVGVTFGTGARPASPTLVPVDYCERFQAPGTGPKTGRHGVDDAWAYMAIPIARRIDPTLAARCDVIEASFRPRFRGRRGDLQHLGAG